jgi:hypothetical protein
MQREAEIASSDPLNLTIANSLIQFRYSSHRETRLLFFSLLSLDFKRGFK